MQDISLFELISKLKFLCIYINKEIVDNGID